MMNRPTNQSRIPTSGSTPLKTHRLSDTGPPSNPATPSPAKSDVSFSARLATPVSSNKERTPVADQRGERVRVVVRVRPALRDDETEGAVNIGEGGQTLTLNRADSIVAQSDFTFDTVLSAAASQHDVYVSAVKEIVDDVLSGYNGTVMAYGQTGAGKTFTIGNTDPKTIGMIPRSMAEIFKRAAEDPGNAYTVTMSYIQIYVEQIQDLLNPEADNLQIREDPSGAVHIPGVREQPVTNVEQCLHFLELGERNRTFAFTHMNAHSSRSHAVVMLTVTRRSRRMTDTEESEMRQLEKDGVLPQKVKMGKLFLVDLAGSERLKKSKSTGTRANEAIHINLSLTTLGMCINARANQERHVPFRDSKLTRLLQESLGGNAKTTLIVCVANVVQHTEETLQSLQFGTRAMKVKVKPVVNEVIDYQKLKAELMAEVDSERERAAQEMVQSLYKQNIDEMQDKYKKEKAQFQQLIDALKTEQEKEEAERLRLLALKDKELQEKQQALEAHQQELEEQRLHQGQLASALQEIQGEKEQLQRSAAQERGLLAQQLRDAQELISNLKEQKAMMEDQLAKERQGSQAKLSEALASIKDLQAERKALEEASKAEAQSLQTRITAAETTIASLQEQLSSLKTAAADEKALMQSQITHSQAETLALQQRIVEVQGQHVDEKSAMLQQITDSKLESSTLQQRLLEAQTRHADEKSLMQQQITDRTVEVGSLQQRLSQTQAQHADEKASLEKQINESQAEVGNLQWRLLETQAHLADTKTLMEKQSGEAQAEVSSLQQRLAEVQATALADKTSMQAQIADRQGELLSLQQRMEAAQAAATNENTMLQGQITQRLAEISALQQQLADLQAASAHEKDTLSGQIAEGRAEISSLQQRLSEAQAAAASERDVLQDQIAGSQAEASSLRQGMVEMQAQHNAALEAAVQQHRAELAARDAERAALSDRLQADMAQLRDLHASEVSKLHESMTTLREAHASEVAAIRHARDMEVEDMAARHSIEVLGVTERLHRSEEAGKRGQDEISSLQSNLADLRKDKADVEKRLAAMMGSYQHAHQSMLLLQTNMADMVSLSSSRLMAVESRLYDALEVKSRAIRSIKRKVQDLQGSVEGLQETRRQLLANKAALTEQVAGLEQRLQAWQGVVAEQAASIQQLQASLAGSQGQCSDLQAQKDQLLGKVADLEGVQQQLEATRQQLEATVRQLEGSKEQLEARVSDLEAAQRQLEADKQRLETSVQQLEATTVKLEAYEQELEATISSKDAEISGLRTQVAGLEENLSTASRALHRSQSSRLEALQVRVRARKHLGAALTIQQAWRRFKAARLSGEIHKGNRALTAANRQLANMAEQADNLKLTQQQQLAGWGAAMVQDSKRQMQAAVSAILREFALPKRELDAHKRVVEAVGRMQSSPATPQDPPRAGSFNRGNKINFSRQSSRMTDAA